MKEKKMKQLLGFGIAMLLTLQNSAALMETFAVQTALRNFILSRTTVSSPEELTHNTKFNDCVRIDGIDVSKFQGTINWNSVAADGIDYSIIRLGYRGYGTGKLVVDPMYETNIQGALNAGLDVGVYFFTQAITVEEAVEEANFVLEYIRGYDITMPVYIDIEEITYDVGRLDSANLNNAQRTAICDAFCDTIEAAGYEAGVYANKYWLTSLLNSSQLESEHHIWLANYTNLTTYDGEYNMWQYSSTGTVNGISGNVDRNVLYSKKVSYSENSITFNSLNETACPLLEGDGRITYTSSNSAVASVNSCGIITATGSGTAIITASSDNGTSDTIVVNVNADLKNSMNFSTMFLTDLGADVILASEDASSDSVISWSSSDQNVVTVDENGVITATGYGKAQIIAADNKGRSAECTVNVIELSENAMIGDVNLDGTIDAADAALILSVSAQNGCKSKTYYSDGYLQVFDMNEDTVINAVDAALVLAVSANAGTNKG